MQRYRVFDPQKDGFKETGGKVPPEEIDRHREGIFSFFSARDIHEVFSFIYQKEGVDVGFLIWTARNPGAFWRLRDTLVSSFGIYQKTKNLSSIYLFDEEKKTGIEFTSGTLEGDEIMLSYADRLAAAHPALERTDFLCDVEETFDDDPDLQDFIG